MKHVISLILTIAVSAAIPAPAFAAEELPQSFTLDGRLYSDAAGTTPLNDPSVNLVFQILNDDQTCILYEETRTGFNSGASSGYFNLPIGSAVGDAKRTAGFISSMANVYSNTVTSLPGEKVSDRTACTYNPIAGHQRYLRILVTPSLGGAGTRILSPNMALDSVPHAIVAERAETLRGLGPTNFLQTNTTGAQVLTQTNVENVFTTSNYNTLLALLGGTSTLYTKPAANGTTMLPNIAAPASPAAGQIWYDSGAVKYYDGTTTKTLNTGASTQVAAGAGTAGAPSISFSGDTDTGWYSPSANNLAAATGGVERVRIDANGSVGVGTADPTFGTAYGANETQIGVTGKNDSTNSIGRFVLANNRPTATNLDFTGFLDFVSVNNPGSEKRSAGIGSMLSGAGGLNGYGGDLRFYTKQDDSTYTQKMIITPAGNVGIGTTSPSTALHVASGAVTVGPGNAGNYLYSEFAGSSGFITTGGAFPLRLGTSSGEKLRISPTGLVGIGTTSPAALLDVAGTGGQFAVTPAGTVGVGNPTPLGTFAVSPRAYSTGTASQVASTITGVGTTWTAAMVGKHFTFANGVSAGTILSRASNTSINVETSQTVASQNYGIYNSGLQVWPNGNVGINTGSSQFRNTAPYSQPMAPLHIAGSGNLIALGGCCSWNGFIGVDFNGAISFTGSNSNFGVSNTIQAGGYLINLANASGNFRVQRSGTTFLFGEQTSGFVGIGTTTPGRLLHVNGPMRVQPATLPASPVAGDIAIDSSDSNKMKFYDGTGWIALGTATTDASLLTTGTLPDARLSTNVALKNTPNDFTDKNTITVATTTKEALVLKSSDNNLTKKIFETQSSTGVVTTSIAADGIAIASTDLTTKGYVDTAVGAVPVGNYVLKAGDTMTGALLIPVGSTGAPGLAFAGDSDTGLWRTAADQIGFTTGGINAGGITTGDAYFYRSVTSYSASGGNLRSLRVADPTAVNDVLGNLSFGSNTTTSAQVGAVATEAWSGSAKGSYMRFQTTATGTTTMSEKMRVTDAGNVGIGTITPGQKLEVAGAIKIASTATGGAGTLRWNGSNFQGNDGTSWFNIMPNPPAAGGCDQTQVFNSAGTYGYTVPAGYATITVKVWGGGGGGGYYFGASGSPGVSSSISSLGLSAGGGSPGTRNLGIGGAGGTGSGGTTNLVGGAGTGGTFDSTGGTGGNAPSGGGTGGLGASAGAGIPGGVPGGGGGGGSPDPTAGTDYTSGGGAGGYTEKVYTPATLPVGTTINDIVVGDGGVGYDLSHPSRGGKGGSGQVSIVCSTTGAPPVNNRGVLFLDSGAYSSDTNFVFDSSGNLGIGTPTPARKLHVAGPMRVQPAALPGTPAAGDIAIDSADSNKMKFYDGTSWITMGAGSGGTYTNVTSIANSSGNIVMAPTATSGSVQINSGTTSTSSTSGALVVTGGIGASGDIYSGGSVNVGSSLSVATLGYIPQLYGSSASGGDVKIDGTSHATPGDVLLATVGTGKVGVGALTPTAKLDVQGGAIRSVSSSGSSTNNTAASADWSTGNNQSMSVACTTTAFTNMLDGATYNLFVTDTTATQCTFSQAGLTFYYSPANGSRLGGLPTFYSFTRIGNNVIVSWAAMNP